jgi:hypothetical protein
MEGIVKFSLRQATREADQKIAPCGRGSEKATGIWIYFKRNPLPDDTLDKLRSAWRSNKVYGWVRADD